MVAPGDVLQDRYRLDSPIATGGMGEVWRGTDLALQRAVAIKLLRPECAWDEDVVARFRAEARYAALLSHPNIARIYDYCEMCLPDPGCLVMELIDGLSLARVLDDGPLTPAHTMGIIAQAAAGLRAAHASDVVHRDIKPGNLLVSPDGLVKITDFGIAHSASSAPVTRTGIVMGTPAYLAPERAAGASATPASDLYSLGVVAYQCLTGRIPFDGEPIAVVVAHLQHELPPLPPTVPAEVAALVADLTAKDPRDRPTAWEATVRAERLRACLTSPAAVWPGLAVASGAATRMLSALSGSPRHWANSVSGPPPWRRDQVLPGRVPARAGLVLASALVATMGWVVAAAHGSGLSAGERPGPHPATRQASPRRTPGPHHVAATYAVNATAGNPTASRAPARHSHSSGPATPPPASPVTSGTPAPSATPSGTPTPSASASPSPAASPPSSPTPQTGI